MNNLQLLHIILYYSEFLTKRLLYSHNNTYVLDSLFKPKQPCPSCGCPRLRLARRTILLDNRTVFEPSAPSRSPTSAGGMLTFAQPGERTFSLKMNTGKHTHANLVCTLTQTRTHPPPLPTPHNAYTHPTYAGGCKM